LIAAFHQLAAFVTALPNITIAKKNRKINKVFFSGATKYYGINGVPTMVLIGRDSKVISLETRRTTERRT
jgi:hypothetical protein